MHLSLPIRLDREVHLLVDGNLIKTKALRKEHMDFTASFIDATGKPLKVSARDTSRANKGLGIVLTNLVGIKDGILQKRCPACGTTKAMPDYCKMPRTMADGEERDQSDCNTCRKA